MEGCVVFCHWLLSLTMILSRFVILSHVTVLYFFWWPNNLPSYRWIPCFHILQLTGTWILPTFMAIMNNSVASMSTSFCVDMFSFLLGGIASYMVAPCLVFWETVRMFQSGFTTSPSHQHIRELQSLYLLSNFFFTPLLVAVKRCLLMVLTCISLRLMMLVFFIAYGLCVCVCVCVCVEKCLCLN
jgi:hypothetical protein